MSRFASMFSPTPMTNNLHADVFIWQTLCKYPSISSFDQIIICHETSTSEKPNDN